MISSWLWMMTVIRSSWIALREIVPLFEHRPQLAVLHFPQRTDEYAETLAQYRLWLGTFDAFVC